MDVRYRRWEAWPQEATPRHKRKPASSFRAGYTTVIEDLEDELLQLKARDVVIETGHSAGSFRLDGWLRADAGEPHEPGVILSFDSVHGPLRYLCDRYAGWRANLRAISLTLEALRAVDRYGAATRAEQYTGWSALPSGEASAETARRLLLAEAGYDHWTEEPAFQQTIYRRALKHAHPDGGGTTERLQAVQAAARFLGIVEPVALPAGVGG